MIQTFTATLEKKESLTKDTLELKFSIPEEITFQAGQFVSFAFESEGKKQLRSYSILNPPSEKGTLALCLRVLPDGLASGEFGNANPGAQFECKGPFGHFVFTDNAPEHWFVGVGTGIAPLYSMIKEHLPHTKKPFVLLLGVRFEEDLLFHDELLGLEKKYPHFSYRPTLSRGVWHGRMGRVQGHLREKDLTGKTFYICGTKDMVLETKELLLAQGVAKEHIKFERYT